jgi:hypothetical protein
VLGQLAGRGEARAEVVEQAIGMYRLGVGVGGPSSGVDLKS